MPQTAEAPLRAESRIFVAGRLKAIPDERGVLLFSGDTLTCASVSWEAGRLLMGVDQGAPLLHWVERHAEMQGLPVDTALGQVAGFIGKLREYGLVALERVPETVNWPGWLAQETDASRVCYLDLTHRCNLRCSYCYNVDERAQAQASGEPELSDGEVLELLERLAENRFDFVVFTGGEPLLRRPLFTFARRARELGLRCNLLTNGTLITRERAGQIADLFDTTIVSLDSSRAEAHDAQRGRGAFRRTVAGLRHLTATARANFSLRPVITRHTIDHLHELPAFAYEQFGCTTFQPTLYLPNSLDEATRLGLLPDPERYRCGMERYYAALESIPNGHSEDPLDSVALGGQCGMGRSIFSISSSGAVYPCQSLHEPELCLGHVRRQPLEVILCPSNPHRIGRIPVTEIPVCRHCSVALLCGGGCRAAAFSLYRRLHATNELLCPYFRADAEQTILRHYHRQTGTAD